MVTQNCWEFMECGREPDGPKVNELGVCLAATDTTSNGLNAGTNAGRICWAVAGTFCGGATAGEFVSKMDDCVKCDFYHTVFNEAENFEIYPSHKERMNCWEFMKCGREAGGPNAEEMGVCPAAIDSSVDGMNGGANGGRICWAVAGTFCGGAVQGEFATKIANCISCDFYNQALNEETEFIMHPTDVKAS